MIADNTYKTWVMHAFAFVNLIVVTVLTLSQPASANGSAIALCMKHGFHAFYQNMKTKKSAIANARRDCAKIGIQKFKMNKKAAWTCCGTVLAISKGCVAVASGLGTKEQRYYEAYGKWRIPTVLKALKSCENDYFDCQVKMTTCVGGR